MFGQNTILLVEDNRDDEDLMLRALKQHHITNEIVVCNDGVVALDYLFGSCRTYDCWLSA